MNRACRFWRTHTHTLYFVWMCLCAVRYFSLYVLHWLIYMRQRLNGKRGQGKIARQNGFKSVFFELPLRIRHEKWHRMLSNEFSIFECKRTRIFHLTFKFNLIEMRRCKRSDDNHHDGDNRKQHIFIYLSCCRFDFVKLSVFLNVFIWPETIR